MDILTFGVIGIATGALYALVGMALVVVYRGSGLVNFALGAYVMGGGYTYYELHENAGWPLWVSAAGAIALVTVAAVAVELVIAQGMRSASALARVMVTLGVLITLNAIVRIRYENRVLTVPSLLPTRTVSVGSSFNIGLDRILIFVIGAALAAALWTVYRHSRLGRLTSTIAENPSLLSASGHSPTVVAVANSAVAGSLCGIAGILVPPISGLNATSLPLIVLPGMAAAVIGSFASFPMAFAGAMIIGVAEAESQRFVSWSGVPESIPFIVIIAYLAVRGRGLPLRSYVAERLPVVGNGRLRPVSALIGAAIALYAVFNLDYTWQGAITSSAAIGIVALSIVLVTGYAGQVTLASFVVGGTTALILARFQAHLHWDLSLVMLAAFPIAGVIGLLVGLPSLRTRGVNLTIVTLGLGIILYSTVLTNTSAAGGVDGIAPGQPTIFGVEVDTLRYPARYGALCIVVLVLVACGLANLRRGQAGQRLLAVRGNERAAAALGVNVYAAKLFAFSVASGFAAIGVTLYAFMSPSVLPAQFDVLTSIGIVTAAVIGGVGLIPGAIIGGLMFPTGVANQLLTSFDLSTWLPLIGGIATLLVLRFNQDGIVQANIDLARSVARLARSSGGRPQPDRSKLLAGTVVGRLRPAKRDEPDVSTESLTEKVAPQALIVTDLTVAFGGVVAVNDVSLRVEPGTVHGLIGPNGAGKTTLIDAVTGFVKTEAGQVRVGGADLSKANAAARSNAGLRRTFQGRELFPDLTIGENIAMGCDQGGWRCYALDFVHPKRTAISAIGRVAVRELGLQDVLGEAVDKLPFGRRGLASLARVIAGGPSVVLLDEPASGLDPAERRELSALVRRLADDWGMSVLIVEHDVDLVWSVCDEVTVLVGGRVAAHGSPDEVRANQTVREAYMGLVGDVEQPLQQVELRGRVVGKR